MPCIVLWCIGTGITGGVTPAKISPTHSGRIPKTKRRITKQAKPRVPALGPLETNGAATRQAHHIAAIFMCVSAQTDALPRDLIRTEFRKHAIRRESATLSVFSADNEPLPPNQLPWNYPQGLGGFTAIVPEATQDTAKTRLFQFGTCLAAHLAESPRFFEETGYLAHVDRNGI